MKTMCYIFPVILSLIFPSCSNDEDSDINNFSSSTLIFKAAIPPDPSRSGISNGHLAENNDTILLFSGKDIAWFNETTGELKFNDNFVEEVTTGNGPIDLLVYSDSNALYMIDFFLTYDVMSWVINSPVIYKSIGENAYYIKNGYPDRDLADLDKDHPWKIERETNWNELVQSEGWKLFILQLKKEGRYRK